MTVSRSFQQLRFSRRKAATIQMSFCSIVLAVMAGCGGTADTQTAEPEKTTQPKKADVAQAQPEVVAQADTPTTTAAPQATPEEKPAAKTPPKKAVDPSATGSFFGRIALDGDAPELAPLTKADDEKLKDKEVCGAADIPDESLLVGEGNGIANVFVYLRRAPKGYKSEVPTDAVVLDQKGCIFTPHVAMIRAGQKVLVKSSDAIQHNVHTFPARNQSTNLLINPNEQTGIELTYAKPESDPLQVKCDIHAWMASYHLVLDHPFMAITDAAGNFRIDGLPAGDYDFRIWHEKGGLLEKGLEATVSGEDEAVELKYAADKFAG